MKILLSLILLFTLQHSTVFAQTKKTTSKKSKSSEESSKEKKSKSGSKKAKKKDEGKDDKKVADKDKSKGKDKGKDKESTKKPESTKEPEVARETTKSEKVSTKPKLEIRGGLAFWQETLNATRGDITSKFNTQTEGVALTFLYDNPFESSRWSYTYGGDFAVGFIKGSSADGDLADTMKNQHWFYMGGRVGVLNRTSNSTSYGFEIPVLYRSINWQLSDDVFDPEKDTSFSAGVGVVYENHFNQRSTLHLSLTHQYMWQATVWLVAYQRKL